MKNVLFVALFLAPTLAGANELPATGTWVLAGDVNFRALRWSGGATAVEVTPSADVFVAGGLSLGGTTSVYYSGYDVGVDMWALAPGARAGVGYTMSWPVCPAGSSCASADQKDHRTTSTEYGLQSIIGGWF